jgi:ABC-type polar amino acid transport system ATPase subunit
MDTMSKALKEGKDKDIAEKLANNALTQAGLQRIDALPKKIEKIQQQRILDAQMRLTRRRRSRI